LSIILRKVVLGRKFAQNLKIVSKKFFGRKGVSSNRSLDALVVVVVVGAAGLAGLVAAQLEREHERTEDVVVGAEAGTDLMKRVWPKFTNKN
jgi:hypothetical protein